MEAAMATIGETNMGETPEEWLGRLFEYEYCAECGGDAEDHVVCLVPGMGTYFARCRTASVHTTHPDDGRSADRGA